MNNYGKMLEDYYDEKYNTEEKRKQDNREKWIFSLIIVTCSFIIFDFGVWIMFWTMLSGVDSKIIIEFVLYVNIFGLPLSIIAFRIFFFHKDDVWYGR